jgi:hypothetical protein
MVTDELPNEFANVQQTKVGYERVQVGLFLLHHRLPLDSDANSGHGVFAVDIRGKSLSLMESHGRLALLGIANLLLQFLNTKLQGRDIASKRVNIRRISKSI